MDKNDVLKVSKNLYAAIPALLDGMPMGFAVMRVLIDEEGEPFDFVYEYANSLFAYLENMSLERLKQYSWGQLFPDEEMQVLGAYANIALNGGNRVIEEVEEGGDRKLRINCYQPAYGYCALIVEEVPNDKNHISVQEMPKEPVVTQNMQTMEPEEAPSFTEEPQQAAPLLDEAELYEMQKLAQMAAPVNEAPEAAVPVAEEIPVGVAPIEEIPVETTPAEVTPIEEIPVKEVREPQQAGQVLQAEPAREEVQAAPVEAENRPEEPAPVEIAPLEQIREPQPVGQSAQAIPEEPAREEVQAASAEAENRPEKPAPVETAPLEKVSEPQPVGQSVQPAPEEPAREEVQAAPAEAENRPEEPAPVDIAPLEQMREPQQPEQSVRPAPEEPAREEVQAAPVETAPIEEVSRPQQTVSVEEVITGGVTVSDIVEENKPEGYATIADLMASANMKKEEPVQENTGEGTPIGSIVGGYGGDSEGVWSEPESSEDVVEFTEVETFEVDTFQNAESFESQEDTATFVAVGEESGFDMQPLEEPAPAPSAVTEPVEEVPELKADENSFMAKIKKVVESIDQFNEDMALEILDGLLNDSSLDANVAGDVKKVKAMVECSMFAEAKELAQSLVAS